MRWIEVTSSNLKLVGVEGADLMVTFHHQGAQYRYTGAGALFADLVKADSPGKFFNANVRDQYRAERIG